MLAVDASLIDPIRTASRELVRELGFTSTSFAGTTLSPSAVHALIEIEMGCWSVRELGDKLKLEKSSVSRMLRKLVTEGLLDEITDREDGRVKRLSLSAAGRKRMSVIHAFAVDQISSALARLRPEEAKTVLDGLRLYTAALGNEPPRRGIEIVQGYRPGLVGHVIQMHARYYARTAGFGQRFESVIARGLAAFCDRADDPENAIWTAVRGGEIVGSIAIEGEDQGEVAHLRWFIVDDSIRGGGVGRRLLETALAFADARPFTRTYLWTFDGLTSARHLYEQSGFTLAQERKGEQWGSEVLEQLFIRTNP